MSDSGYELLDSGGGRKLERFGRYTLARPCSQALWAPSLPAREWEKADASFDRLDGNRWHGRANLPEEWTIETADVKFKLGGTDFGHLGIFPEQRDQWKWLRKACRPGMKVLNLFAYSGGSTMASALAGAETCHLDASRGMVEWARANAALNGLSAAPIRWITDDACKFMARETRRGRKYDAIILDPPTFGRGASGETYKIERDLGKTLDLVQGLLSGDGGFILFSSHTPGISRIVAENMFFRRFGKSAAVESGEMLLQGRGMACPSGIFCKVVF